MKAWKNSPDYEMRNGSGASGGLIGITGGAAAGASAGATNGGVTTVGGNGKIGTGWVSELNPRKGVLTFDNNGKDERVLFLASKVYHFEKRIGSKQNLTGKTEGAWVFWTPDFLIRATGTGELLLILFSFQKS